MLNGNARTLYEETGVQTASVSLLPSPFTASQKVTPARSKYIARPNKLSPHKETSVHRVDWTGVTHHQHPKECPKSPKQTSYTHVGTTPSFEQFSS
jgi:hypothetical protein